MSNRATLAQILNETKPTDVQLTPETVQAVLAWGRAKTERKGTACITQRVLQ